MCVRQCRFFTRLGKEMANIKALSSIGRTISLCVISIFTLAPTSAFGTELSELKCARGWGSTTADWKYPIPKDWINDGYCDCPLEGIDEPDTGACSGSVDGGWAGVQPKEDKVDPEYFYECPYEKHLRLPPSQINDGICDCCDGSDERSTSSSCVDSCQELRAAEEARITKMKESFRDGSSQRKQEIEKYKEYREQSIKDFNEVLNTHLPKFEGIVTQAEETVKASKHKYLFERRNTFVNLAQKLSIKGDDDDSIGLLEVLNDDEIIDLIVGICQLSAERNSNVSECEALVKAGLELGFVEKDGAIQALAQNDVEGIEFEIEHLIDNISGSILDIEGISTSDDIDNEDDEEFHHMLEQLKDENASDALAETGVKSGSSTIISRTLFEEEATRVLDLIALYFSDSDDDEHLSTIPDVEKIDPIAIQKTKHSLQKKLLQVKNGKQVAELTREQMNTISQIGLLARMDLMRIAVGVIYHSSISSSNIVELLYHIVPELAEKDDEEVCDISVCRSDHTAIMRESLHPDSQKNIQIPPAPLLYEYAKTCQHRMKEFVDLSNQCLNIEESTSQRPIPNEITDGFMNYFSYKKRDENESDPLLKIFKPLEDLSEDIPFKTYLKGLASAEEELKHYQSERNRLQTVVGGESSKYGPFGELYALRDSCHSVISAKYEYEICFHGQAYQREATGGTKNGGTGLGKWKGFEVSDNGQMVLKFEGGQRCWNGPARSATVILTCGGSGTKLLSVEEPETCRYQMEMESYVTCDDNFAKIHGLSEE